MYAFFKLLSIVLLHSAWYWFTSDLFFYVCVFLEFDMTTYAKDKDVNKDIYFFTDILRSPCAYFESNIKPN